MSLQDIRKKFSSFLQDARSHALDVDQEHAWHSGKTEFRFNFALFGKAIADRWFVCSSVCLSIYRSVCLPICLSVYLPIYLSIYLSVCLSTDLSVCLPICVSIFLATFLSSVLFVHSFWVSRASLILCYFMICHAMLCCAVCCVVLCYAIAAFMLCYDVYVMLCYVMSCYVVLCYVRVAGISHCFGFRGPHRRAPTRPLTARAKTWSTWRRSSGSSKR